MNFMKKRLKRPSKERVIQVLGWYATRIAAVVLWSGVVWAILGNEALPQARVTVQGTGTFDCIPTTSSLSSDYNSNDSTLLYQLLDHLNVSVSSHTAGNDTLFVDGLYSFIYSCNVTADLKYCLVTVRINEDCLSRVSLSVNLMTELGIPNINSSISNISFDYDIDSAIRDHFSPSPYSSPTQSLFVIPEGHFFALIVLIIVSSIGGMLARVVRLPPLLGMMIGGFLLRNIPVVGIAGDISPVWSSTLRNIALVIILLRGGLALDAKQLWKLKIAVPILALAPCLTEGAVNGLVSTYLLDIPWRWGLMLGFILSAISPAVVVPTTLSLGERVTGINKGITTLIVAAANIDVVIAISLFSVFLGLIFSDGSVVLDAFRAPIEITVGILYGVVCGLLLWLLPTKLHTKSSRARNHFFLLFGFGLFSLFGGRRAIIGGAALSGAGALGILVVSFVAAQKWTSEEKKMVSRSLYLIWQFAQPVLFGLIGAALNISDISGSLIGRAVLLICVGLTLRLTVAVIAVTGNKFTIKEKVFIAISWIPKATVQAAIGSIALDLVRQSPSPNEEDIVLGNTVLTVAVLAIVLCAPVGAILSSILGPWLLKHPPQEDDNGISKEISNEDVKVTEGDHDNGGTATNYSDISNTVNDHHHIKLASRESVV